MSDIVDPPIPLPPKGHKINRNNIRLLIAGVALLGLLAGAVISGVTSKNEDVATVIPAKTVSTKDAVHQWMINGGYVRLMKVGQDARAIGATPASDTTSGTASSEWWVRTQCAVLSGDAQTARDYTAIPDSEAQMYWLASMSYAELAGRSCFLGQYAESAWDLQQATQQVDRLTVRLAAIRASYFDLK